MTGSVQEIIAGYAGGDEMPLTSYAIIMGVYNPALASLLLVAHSSGRRLPDRIASSDLMLLGVATYKLSRLISSDRVTSPLRAPFTEYVAPAGTSEVKEKVRGTNAARHRRSADVPVLPRPVGGDGADVRVGAPAAHDPLDCRHPGRLHHF